MSIIPINVQLLTNFNIYSETIVLKIYRNLEVQISSFTVSVLGMLLLLDSRSETHFNLSFRICHPKGGLLVPKVTLNIMTH